MKTRLFSFLLVCLLAFGLTTNVLAQTYSFQVPKEVVEVFWNADGTIAIDYRFTFVNDASADAIDFVDVGLPNSSYSLGGIVADVDGKPVTVSSGYQGEGSDGVAVELGGSKIRPGKSGVVHVFIPRVERMYYPDSKDEKYASGEFSPTWFGSQFVHGKTDLAVTFHLPPGVKAEDPRYHATGGGWPGASQPETGFDQDGRVTYTWHSAAANGYTQYTFGASYPAAVLPADAIVRTTFLDLIIGGIAALVGMFANVLPFICIGGFFFGLPLLGTINERKRKMQYLPPKISIEGHGIKRGLTAVEAAILMGQPLEKVMTMILFGVVKKEAAQVATRDPLELNIAPVLPTNLRDYETDFLEAMRQKSPGQRRPALAAMTVKLIKSVTEKMKGFSSKETVDYYKAINEKAWQQIEAAGTPEVKSQMLEEALEWTMLDKEYDDRARRTFTGPIIVPTWWGRYDPVYRHSHPTFSSVPLSTGSPSRSALPGADFAATVVTGTQGFAQKVLGGDFTQSVTNITNPVPISSQSGGRSSGGSGCACACACAGCACACAGGGR